MSSRVSEGGASWSMHTPPAPTAQGSFSKTPFPHLLVYALERRLTGSFELYAAGQALATLVVVGGAPAKVRTAEPVHFLGDVLVDLGMIDAASHGASLTAAQEQRKLHGQVLLEAGVIDPARLEAALRAQLERKLEHLFSLPVETEFAYFDGYDALAGYGGAPTPIDPFPVLWRGIRQRPAWDHVDATLKRVGGAAVRIGPASQVDRFQFTRAEASAVELLRQRTMKVVELAGTKVVGPSAAQLLVYTLVITKQVEIVETASMRPGAPARGPAIPTPAQAAPPLSGQAFARVQLQARSVQRQPLVVEEVAPVPSTGDGRIASPMPQPIPLGADAPRPPAESAPGDIGAMISTAIQSSIPPPDAPASTPHVAMPPTPSAGFSPPPPPSAPPSAPAVAIPPPPAPSSMGAIPVAAPSASAMRAASAGAVPVAPPVSAPAIAAAAPPSAPGSQRELTAEQNALKSRIVEKAAAITSQNFFTMLGVDETAPVEVIQKTFFGLAKVWHPDRLPAALADVKDECSKVFTHLTEAHATLTDPERRASYMKLLKEGGATPDEQAKVQAVLEAATLFQKAEFHLKRNDLAAALDHAKRAHDLDGEQADYLALLAWIEAQLAPNLGREKTLEKVALLDRALKMNPNCASAYFYRAQLYKRAEDPKKAYADFKKASELNPRNLDAAREVRLHKMRGGGSMPPPTTGPSAPSPRPGQKPAPTSGEGLGGLFGKLFKK